MNYLIIAATAMEIGPFLEKVQATEITGGVDVLVTGVGLTATTYSLTRQIALKPPDCIIQAGIAGSFNKNIDKGSVLVVGKDLVADQGVFEPDGWKSTTDMGFTPPDKPPYNNGWLVNPDLSLNRAGLEVANAVSVNQVTTDPRLIADFTRKFNPTLESMEGAALHYVAISEQIPFLQLRAVSNYVGERDKKKWDLKDAVTNLNKELLNLLT